jgi:hypothetical protein
MLEPIEALVRQSFLNRLHDALVVLVFIWVDIVTGRDKLFDPQVASAVGRDDWAPQSQLGRCMSGVVLLLWSATAQSAVMREYKSVDW